MINQDELLEKAADEATIKYRENPGMRPQELFLLGASWAKEQDKADQAKKDNDKLMNDYLKGDR